MQARQMRNLLAGSEIVVAPGVYDGLTARLVEQAGFKAAYMTGAGTSMAFGYPDYGLLTATEMVANADRIAASIAIPLIADADTGYGNELNVTRAVRDYERAGVAAIHIEDQVFPKRCGHTAGKEVVPKEEWVSKIKAAVAARRTPDFVVIARTDARGVTSFDDAVARANAALAVGADLAFVEGPTSMDEVIAIPAKVAGPCLLNIVPGGVTPVVDAAEAQRLGYRVLILPGATLAPVIDAVDTALAQIAATGRPAPRLRDDSPAATFARFGSAEWDALRRGESK